MCSSRRWLRSNAASRCAASSLGPSSSTWMKRRAVLERTVARTCDLAHLQVLSSRLPKISSKSARVGEAVAAGSQVLDDHAARGRHCTQDEGKSGYTGPHLNPGARQLQPSLGAGTNQLPA